MMRFIKNTGIVEITTFTRFPIHMNRNKIYPVVKKTLWRKHVM